MAKQKFVYFFGSGKAEGGAGMKSLLGGKGANLAEMTNLGIPVPPGFTISAEVCDLFYKNNRKYPAGLDKEVQEHLQRLEKLMGKKLGDPKDPLLVSVRSGAALSMPGMMDTVLNLGLNDVAVEGLARLSGNERFAWDAYRRFIQMFGSVVRGIEHDAFEHALDAVKKKKGVEEDLDLDAADLQEVVKRYKEIYKKHTKEAFPQQPAKQLWAAIDAVFGSWNNPRAIRYRQINEIKGLLGTAVNVQTMVFGNLGDDSGTGVCFTRDPSTGENEFYGEYLMNAQGEDVVAGIRTPLSLKSLAKKNPKIYKELNDVRLRLEKHYKDMQDMEFTIQQGKLYLLQTRTGKRTGPAAVEIAVDMVKEKLITKEEAVQRVSPDQLDQLLHPMIDPKMRKSLKSLAKGLNASPGAATGQIVFTADEAEEWVKKGHKVLLVRRETSPDDIGGMHVSQGILTSTGGMTSHAAVVARGMGTPCVAGCKAVAISGNVATIDGKKYKEGDWLTIDGSTGDVFEGEIKLVQAKVSGELAVFLSWADEVRLAAVRPGLKEKGFRVRTNADLPRDAKVARGFGAEGIGLTRTEHMFFDEGRLEIFQEMIVAEDLEARKKALKKLLPLQKGDFKGIFKAMDGLPVTIRLLDPPLHEFVPKTPADTKALADKIGITVKKLQAKIDSLHELNPMLGHRGCRLGVTYPEIYDMQVQGIAEAACEVAKAGVKVLPEIMIPLVGVDEELRILHESADRIVKEVMARKKVKLDYKIGTMIEIPRAALTADRVAKVAEFFSFGTNDLTQMTFGYSRDDAGVFLPEYVEKGILEKDPFQALDQEGVGQLVQLGTERGRSTRPDLKVGICGEHGGDPSSIEFCYNVGMNYVSCSPYRVPIARLAAAQAVINGRRRGDKYTTA
ncbi:MAG: pyruvate, phosphate dikinase [Spirochaetales bacterium]|nr:pyruvate, phosphate dikinase [Spirochaetales bacterium]